MTRTRSRTAVALILLSMGVTAMGFAIDSLAVFTDQEVTTATHSAARR